MKEASALCQTKRNGGVDLLKFLASLCIVFHHYQQVCGIGYDRGIFFYGEREWFGWGFLVQFFFMTSGYFMFKYVDAIRENKAGSVFSWIGKRALRLLPCVAISAVCFEVLSYVYKLFYGQYWGGLPLSVSGTIVTALGLQGLNIFPNPFINNPTWFVSILLWCYVVFYLVTALAGKLKCKPFGFYGAMIALGIWISTLDSKLPLMNYQIGYGYFAFFFGVLLAAAIRKWGIPKALVFVSCACALGGLYLLHKGNALAVSLRVYVQTFCVYPAFLICSETDLLKKVFRHKIWSELGKISFQIYLWHSPLIIFMYIFTAAVGCTPDFSRYMWVFGIVATVAGTAAYYLLEKPINAAIGYLEKRLKKKA